MQANLGGTVKRRADVLLAAADRRRLRNTSFSIIANDCWGAAVYQRLNLPYSTPFVGLFVPAPDYLLLLRNLPGILSQPLRFSSSSKYDVFNHRRRAPGGRAYPIGVFPSGIEVHFLHYVSVADADTAWRKRVRRIDYHRLWVKFDGSDELATGALRAEFEAMPYERKVMFVNDRTIKGRSVSHLEKWQVDGFAMVRSGGADFDLVRWLNDGTVSRPSGRRIRQFAAG